MFVISLFPLFGTLSKAMSGFTAPFTVSNGLIDIFDLDLTLPSLSPSEGLLEAFTYIDPCLLIYEFLSDTLVGASADVEG